MVSLRGILAEARRELGRSTGPGTLAAALALAGGFAVFALAELGPGGYAAGTYLFLPLLVGPLAAQRVAGDRERGLAAVAATTPLDRTSYLLGRALGLLALLVAAVALTLPGLYALTETVAPGAFRAALPLAGWALLVGTVSLLAGLAVGYAATGPSTRALSTAGGLVAVWFLLAAQRRRILSWADGATERQVLEAVVHASPMTWALEAEHPAALGVVDGHLELARGLGLLAPGLVVALGALALGLQHLDGWFERPLRRPVALGLLVVGLAGVGAALAAADTPRPPAGPAEPAPAEPTPAGDVNVSLQVDAREAWRPSTDLGVELTLAGPPNATVHVEELALGGPHLDVEHGLATPSAVSLDEVREGHGRVAPEDEAVGLGELAVDARATPDRVADLFLVRAEVTVDGDRTTAQARTSLADWALPAGALLGAVGGPLAAAGGLAVLAPRRWNRW
jgi:hypothetical protein